jgi:hypothetical protein
MPRTRANIKRLDSDPWRAERTELVGFLVAEVMNFMVGFG